jgi:hypothetical protein
MAIVVHVRLMKTRFKDVDQDDNIGMAKNEARGRVKGASNADRDILVTVYGEERDGGRRATFVGSRFMMFGVVLRKDDVVGIFPGQPSRVG